MTVRLKFRHVVLCSGLAWLVMSGFLAAQDTLASVLEKLRSVQTNASASTQDLSDAVASVQRILDDFPGSDAAVSILLGEPYDGIDFASFEKRLQTASVATPSGKKAGAQPGIALSCLETALNGQSSTDMVVSFATDGSGNLTDLPQIVEPETPGSKERLDYVKVVAALEDCAPYQNAAQGVAYQLAITQAGPVSVMAVAPPSSGKRKTETAFVTSEPPAPLPIGTEATEEALDLDRQAIRDIQARLLVLGHDPNGVDGVFGRGTRAAVRAWQASLDTAQSGFLNAPLLAVLTETSQSALDEWLQVPANARVYNAPAARAKRRVRVCSRNALGLLYNCRIEYR